MILAIQIHPDIVGIEIPEHAGNIQPFAIVDRNGTAESLSFDSTITKDMARSLIAHNIDILITRQLSLETFILLKSYGICVYAATSEPITLEVLVDSFKEGKLTEITSDNYAAMQPYGAETVVQSSASSSSLPAAKERK